MLGQLGVKKVLIDRSQLCGEQSIEHLQDAGACLHDLSFVVHGRSGRPPYSRSMTKRCLRHFPHTVPAPHARPTSSSVPAPSSMTFRMTELVTASQRQI